MPKKRQIAGDRAWSPELAYAVGLMATDGCLSNDGRHLTLVSKDKEQIENLKKCLGVRAKVGTHQSGRKTGNTKCYRVQWGDVRLYRFLLDIGLMSAKSKVLGKLAVPDEYFFDFLRGSFDGDGSFYSYRDPRWRNSFMFYLVFVSASSPHISWLQENTRRLCGVTGHRTRSGLDTKAIHSLRYAKREAGVVLTRLYDNPRAVALSRKKLKIQRALRIVGGSLPTGR